MQWTHDDGGRQAAGYKGAAGDCFVRAVAIATGVPYQEVYDTFNDFARTERRSKRRKSRSSSRTGVYKETARRFCAAMGLRWTPVMQIGQGCKVHLKTDELPPGRLVVAVSKHWAAVIDGTLHDLSDCSRGGTRCVYGFWRVPDR